MSKLSPTLGLLDKFQLCSIDKGSVVKASEPVTGLFSKFNKAALDCCDGKLMSIGSC